MDLKNLSLLAINTAIKAGLEIMNVYNSDDFGVIDKDDSSPLTKADTAANKLIIQGLEPSNIPFITEEILALEYDERKHWENCWIIDPLDGTKEFIKRNGEFTVNIALIENKRPLLGVIYVPVTGEVYFGNVMDKTFVKSVSKDSFESYEDFILTNVLTPKVNDENIMNVVGSKSHMNIDTELFIEKLKKDKPNTKINVVSKGSSLKFCLVAEGLADIYPRFAPTMEWDTAAGQAICESAGYVVIDQETKKPMVYNRKKLLNSYFLVTKSDD